MQNLKALLEEKGIKSEYKGKGLMACCPFHDDKHPSMQVFSNGFKCYACQASGSLDILMEAWGIRENVETDILSNVTKNLIRNISTNLHCLVGLPNSTPFVGDFRNIKSSFYMANEAFRVDDHMIGFPLYDLESEYRGYIKYEFGGTYINFFTRGYVPFNLQNLNANAPIIVEGVFDALSVIQCGYKNVIATLGTGQIWNVSKILRQIKATNVNILLDSDDAGEFAAKKLTELYRSSRIIKIPEHKQDPNSFGALQELLDTEVN